MYNLLLDTAGDKGRYRYNMDKYIVLQLKLDISMSSPPHTPPRKGGDQMQSKY